ncbi:MAG: EpsG family protein [Thermaceae bacterium]|nr:EpsG family protein [Thermaceae bacterium]
MLYNSNIESDYKLYRKFFLLSVLFTLIFISTFFKSLSVDYINYVREINVIFFNKSLYSYTLEPTFYLLVLMSQLFFHENITFIFFIYSILGISLKFFSFNKLSYYPLFSVIIYSLSYYWLHDFTQIRAGVASAIFLCSIQDIFERNFFKFLLKIIFATLFHYSAILYFPLYFIYNRKLELIYYLLPIIGLFSILTNLSSDFLSIIIKFLPFFIQVKLGIYIDLSNKHFFPHTNVFNLFYTSLLILFYFLIFTTRKKLKIDLIFYLKILSVSIFSFYFFSSIPVLAFRISELYDIVILILFPNVISIYKEKYVFFVFFFFYFLLYFINFAIIQHALNIL